MSVGMQDMAVFCVRVSVSLAIGKARLLITGEVSDILCPRIHYSVFRSFIKKISRN